MLIHTGSKSHEVSEDNPFSVKIISGGGGNDNSGVNPYVLSVPVTPSDTTIFSIKPRGIFCTQSSGNITFELWDGGELTLTLHNYGDSVYPFSPKKILASGTTATSISLLY